jgi:hypothetical protein
MDWRQLITGASAVAALWPATAPGCAAAQVAPPPAATPAVDTSSPGELFRKVCEASDSRNDAIVANARAAGFAVEPKPEGAAKDVTGVILLVRHTAAGRQSIVTGTKRLPAIDGTSDEADLRSCSLSFTAPGWDARGFLTHWLGMPPATSSATQVAFYYTQHGDEYIAIDREHDQRAYIAALNAGRLHIALALENGDYRNLTLGIFNKPDHPLRLPGAGG